MKRYTLHTGETKSGQLSDTLVEDPEGEWCSWRECKEIIEGLRQEIKAADEHMNDCAYSNGVRYALMLMTGEV